METTAIELGGIFSTAASNVVDQASGIATQVLPIGLGLVAIVLAVTFGLKFVKKVTKG